MAEEPIRKEDIIDSDAILAGIQSIIDSLKVLEDTLKKTVVSMKETVKAANPATPEGQQTIKDISNGLDEVTPKLKALSDVEKELTKRQEELSKSTGLNNKEFAAQVKALNSAEKALSGQKKVAEGAEGSINQMKEALKKLNAEYDKLGKEAAQKAAPAIKKLSDELLKAEIAVGRNQRNVGNYASAMQNLGGKIIEAGKSLFGLGAIMALGTKAFEKIKEAILSTVGGMNAMNMQAEITKQLFYDLVTTGKVSFENLKNAAEAADMMNKIRAGDRKDLIEVAKLEREIAKSRFEAADNTGTEKEKLDNLNEAFRLSNKLMDYQIADKKQDLEYTMKILSKQPENEKMLLRQAQLVAEIIGLDTQRFQSTRRLESARTSIMDKSYNDSLKRWYDEIEADKKATEEAAALAVKRVADKLAADKKITASLKTIGQEETMSVKTQLQYGDVQIQGAKEVSTQLIDIKRQTAKTSAEIDAANAEYQKELDRDVMREKMANASAILQTSAQFITILSDITEASKQRELSSAGDNAAARERIEKEYFKKQKALSISQAIINGALSLTNMLATIPAAPINPLYWVGVGISAATVAAQIAIISAQKFAEGGEIFGKSHSEGGTMVEAERGEYIVKKQSTSKYKGLIEAINEDNPMRIAEEIRNRNFHTVWGGVSAQLSQVSRQDPYTRLTYELLKNKPDIYQDSNGDTVLNYADGRKRVIKKYTA